MTDSLRDVAARSLAPVDRRPIYLWAQDHVQMPSVLTVGGFFNPSISRHFLEILDVLQNDRVRKVTLMKPTRGGGSLVGDLWTLWLIANDPGSMMANFQTDPDAKDYSNDRLGWMIRNCGPTAEMLCGDAIQEKKFTHGCPLYIQGPSLANFQAKGIRWMRNEEIWMWTPGRYSQAAARLGDWRKIAMSKEFNIGQGGVVSDDMDRCYEEGDKRQWEVPCLACGQHFPAEIADRREDDSIWGLRWEDSPRTKDKHGDWRLPEVKRKLWYECSHCKHEHHDEAATKAHWNLHGRYRRTNAEVDPETVSFRFTAILSDRWADLAGEFCGAMNALHVGVLEPLIAWTQKKEARSWSESRLVRSRETPTFEVTDKEWSDEAIRFLTVDCQAEGVFWATARAWSKRGESRRLWRGKVHSEAELQKVQEEQRVKPNNVLVDSGAFTRATYAMCVRHGWIALKGDDKHAFVHYLTYRGQKLKILRSYSELRRGDPESGYRSQGGPNWAKLILWSGPTIKDRLQRQMDLGLWLEPNLPANDPDEQEYKRQMAAEYRREKRDPDTGRMERVWVCPSGNNHYRDCSAMQVVGATLAKMIPDLEPEPKTEPLKAAYETEMTG